MDKNYVNTPEFQERLVKQLKKVQQQQHQEKQNAIDFFNSNTFNDTLIELSQLEKNKNFSTNDVIQQTNINKDNLNSLISCFRNNINDHFLFYSETSNLGDETIYFFQEKPLFSKSKNTRLSAKLNTKQSIQIRLDYIYDINMTFITVLDGDEKINTIKRLLNHDLYRLDQLTTNTDKSFEILHGDNEEFKKDSFKLIASIIKSFEDNI